MEFLAAGNFPMMLNLEAETAMARLMLKRYGFYNRLVSFFFRKAAENMVELKKLGYSGIKVMVDSGAFSAYTQDIEINIADYMEFIQENLDHIDWYVNLDAIGRGQESYENYRTMRSEGLNPLPVWHLGTPKKYFRCYLDSTDYIGISLRKKVGVADSISELDRLWCDMLTDSQG